MFINIVLWFGSDSLSGFLFFCADFTSFCTRAFLLKFFVCFFVLFHSYCSHAWVFGKTLLHEFPISYNLTELYIFLYFFLNKMIKMVEESSVKK